MTNARPEKATTTTMKILEAYLRGYSLSRSRATITPDALPQLTSTGGRANMAELATFAIGVGDGPTKETPDGLPSLLDRVVRVLEPDAVKITALRDVEERLKGAQLVADAARKT